MAPYNGTSDEMKAIAKYCRDNGLYTMYRWNGIHTNPPLIITEEQLAEGFDIIDRALDVIGQSRPLGLGAGCSCAADEVGIKTSGSG